MLRKKDLEIVAVGDIDPKLIGKDVGEVMGIDKIGITVSDPNSILRETKADVVGDTTARWPLNLAYKRIFPFIEAGMNVVSTNAELAYPWARDSNIAKEIDELGKKHKVTVVGTGICPGFMFSVLPLTLTSACVKVERIRLKVVREYSDPSPTLHPKSHTYGEKNNFGLAPDIFTRRVEEGHIRFPRRGVYNDDGFMIADCMGWKIDRVEDSIEPVVSKSRRNTVSGFPIEPGTNAGWKQTVRFLEKNKERIRLEYYGLARIAEEDGIEAESTIWIDGEPEQVMVLRGGVINSGFLITSLRLVNIIPQVVKSPPGLLSVKDIPSGFALPEKEPSSNIK